jgi:cobalt-precorrin 5A hydrolase
MDGGEAMIVAGVGFRRGVAAEEIVTAVERALSLGSLAQARLAYLATVESRAGEPGLVDAAHRLSLGIEAVSPGRLAEAEPRLATRSERVARLHGVGSVAEAAALVAAGPDSRLVVPRVSTGRATCAIATGAGR